MFIVFSVVIFFSIVQSIFGVGLLVFGTPTLMLLGYDFFSAAAILLPCSLSISAMQSLLGRSQITIFKYSLLIYSIPPIAISLFMVSHASSIIDLKVLVAIVMLSSAIIRSSENLSNRVALFFRKRQKPYIVFMGGLHGMSNMGGALLTIMVTSVYENKKDIRSNIAYGYMIFATIQLLVLITLKPELTAVFDPLLPLLALLTYLAVDNFLFVHIAEKVFKHSITILMGLYALTLIYSSIN